MLNNEFTRLGILIVINSFLRFTLGYIYKLNQDSYTLIKAVEKSLTYKI
jgi:hypothetical protein